MRHLRGSLIQTIYPFNIRGDSQASNDDSRKAQANLNRSERLRKTFRDASFHNKGFDS